MTVQAPNATSAMSEHEFEEIREMCYQHCGINLQGKEVLVFARLSNQVRKMGLSSFREYCEKVKGDSSGQLMASMIDVLTTNHTSFFREPQHFEFLRKKILPALKPSDSISVWSAACSSGEEPFSIAISLLEELGEKAASRIHILATDVSTRMLKKAERGCYPEDSFSGIPMEMLHRYLLKGLGPSRGVYKVKEKVRALIEFRHANLMESFAHLGRFSVIFCRNVMIYFDQPTQQRLVHRLADCLLPGGYLLVGHSESLNSTRQPLRYIAPAIYRKDGGV
ncbi:MAG TPA: protein-glutamate O-methyltransferase CheR [Acidisarcina sp.]|nr:protein-glutamate O-methyltransferase CheR [Acidisarcina sp.]